MSKVVKPPYWAKINFLHPLARGLVGCWLFNEGTGNKVIDLSGNGNNGTLLNPSWTGGKDGHALSFNGNADLIYVPSAPNLNPASITLMGWVYPTALGTNPRIISKELTVGINQYGLLSSAGTYRLCWATTSGDHDLFAGSVNLNTWQFIVGTIDSSKGCIYKNGVLQGSLATATPIPITDLSLVIGNSGLSSPTRGFPGLISSVMIFNRALLIEEIKWLYREPYVVLE